MKAVLRGFLTVTFLLQIVIDPARAEEPCGGLKQIVSAPMQTLPTGLVYAPVIIAHRQLNFLLDTRVAQSLISEGAAAAAALPRERMNRITRLKFCMDANTCLQEFATADAMEFGGLTAKVRFAVSPGDLETGVPGLLGSDFLHNFDVEFDFARSRVNLFSPDHCQGSVVYWTQSGASRLPMQMNDWGEVILDAELDGRSVRAEIATGFPKSYLQMAQGETKFGIPDKEWKLIKASGVHATSSAAVYEHVFKTLTLNGIEIENVDLTIESGYPVNLGARLYLGMDILRQLHLYLAYKERNLYVSAATAPTLSQPTPSTSPALQQAPSAPPAH